MFWPSIMLKEIINPCLAFRIAISMKKDVYIVKIEFICSIGWMNGWM